MFISRLLVAGILLVTLNAWARGWGWEANTGLGFESEGSFNSLGVQMEWFLDDFWGLGFFADRDFFNQPNRAQVHENRLYQDLLGISLIHVLPNNLKWELGIGEIYRYPQMALMGRMIVGFEKQLDEEETWFVVPQMILDYSRWGLEFQVGISVNHLFFKPHRHDHHL